MANLPTLHPSLTLHLTDRTSTPIISSSTSSTTRTTQALTSLSRSALASHTAASRFNLGSPVRIMVELTSHQPNPNPVVINSFIPPPRHDTVNGEGGRARVEIEEGDGDGTGLLVGIVVAPDGEASAVEARRAAARLERVGRELQACWVEEGGEGGGG